MQSSIAHGSATGHVERDVLTASTSRHAYSAYIPPESSSMAPQHLSCSNDFRSTSVDRMERDVLTSSIPRSVYQSHMLPEFSSMTPPHLLHANDMHGLSNNHFERDVLASSVFRPGYPAHLPPESATVGPHYLLRSSDERAPSTDHLEREVIAARAGAFGLDDNLRVGVRAETGPGALTTSIGDRSYPSLRKDPTPLSQRREAPVGISPRMPDTVRAETGRTALTTGIGHRSCPSLREDPTLLSQRREPSVGISPQMPDTVHEMPDSVRRCHTLAPPAGKSSILFVDGLPKDCTRRELGHLFRPFIGFKDIKLVHKEPRRSGDKAMVLCFVVFNNANCALTALEALQGYKFDDKKLDSPVLKIHFAEFPFRLPSALDDEKLGVQSRTQVHGENGI
ncbi:RNA-binding protein 1-like protein [Drosera capensis]